MIFIPFQIKKDTDEKRKKKKKSVDFRKDIIEKETILLIKTSLRNKLERKDYFSYFTKFGFVVDATIINSNTALVEFTTSDGVKSSLAKKLHIVS